MITLHCLAHRTKAMSKPKAVKHETHKYTCHHEDTDSELGQVRLATPSIPDLVIKPENPNSEKYYYALRIVTGSQASAGLPHSRAFAVITLTGDKNGTGEMKISAQTGFFICFVETCFQTSTYDDLIIECDEDLGDIQLISVGMDLPPESKLDMTPSDWFIDYFVIADYQKTSATRITYFPCYHWIRGARSINPSQEVITVSSKTAIPQQVSNNSLLVDQRNNLLKKRRQLYEWKMFPDSGVPSGIDDSVLNLPLDEQFERAKTINFLGNLFKGKVASYTCELRTSVMEKLSNILEMHIGDHVSLQNLHDFEFIAKTLAKNLEDPSSAKKVPAEQIRPCYEGYQWVSDVEFGRQILNGVNPVLIRKCTEIPSNFAVTDEMVKPLLSNGKTLSEEMESGRVYICDLSEILHDLHTREGYYCAAPFCLLYVNVAQQLVPIAIQLKKDPGPNNPVFLPTDNWFEWLLAKMFYRAADAQFHQISTHYISCHATMEAYGVATMRNLPDAHPLYKLLQPHFRYTMAINSAARAALINKNGILAQNFAVGNEGMEELFKRVATAHSVHWTNIKHNLKERGVDNPDELPRYYYRDDGIKIWDAIESYVHEIIDLFYTNDDEVKNDTEVQQWANEMHTTAFPGFHGAPQGHGFPDKMSSKAELIEYCTLIMFTGSAQHAAVNFGQFHIYGYTPNAPIGMRKPPPSQRSPHLKNVDLMAYLPDNHTAAMATSVTYSLSQFSPDEIFLGGYPNHWFIEEAAHQAILKFTGRLLDVDQEIVKRNEKLDADHYFYLRPTRIPNSITI